MRCIQVMFDSLNRHMLAPYGCDWVETPNFQRLSEKSVTFDRSFVGSMPCMPARRELHTGRYNFLHRSWGPLEPFDDSMPQILKENGIHSHLCSDHYHYWEEGGANYHTKYRTWEIARGQEGDPWICDLTDNIKVPDTLDGRTAEQEGRMGWFRQDCVNHHYYSQKDETYPQAQTFSQGLRFLETNHTEDDWFLHIETFDPHEPYHSSEKFLALYEDDYDGKPFFWPQYRKVSEEERPAIDHIRKINAALISMCDHYMGKILDFMDKHDMWQDTMLIVNTDHGFLLGEHDCWAKCWMPFYNEIAWTPFWVWDPRQGVQNERRQSLVQTIDIAPTVLDFFNLEIPEDMLGKPLAPVIKDDTSIREAGLFGMHGGHVNVTDGKYFYMRAPREGKPNQPLYNYTHMPAHMRTSFLVEEMRTVELAEPFSFTKGCKTMKISNDTWKCSHNYKTMLFDIESDPQQQTPIDDPEIEKCMIGLLIAQMKENDAPAEQYERLGLQEYL